MDVKRRYSLLFDALEDRVFLSVAHPGAVHPSVLQGTLQIPVPAGTTVPATISIEGNGNVSPLGPVSALGTLTAGAQGSGGIVDLASGRGGIVLNFSVTTPHSGRGKPQIHFTITGGTGAFTNASGEGTATESRGNGPDMLELHLHGTI